MWISKGFVGDSSISINSQPRDKHTILLIGTRCNYSGVTFIRYKSRTGRPRDKIIAEGYLRDLVTVS